jgi:hypothetical protein
MEKYSDDSLSPQAALQVASVSKSINLMSVGVATLLSVGMVIDKHSVTVSVLSGVGFYGAIAGLLVLWQPSALPLVLINRQHEVTERRRDMLQYRMHMTQLPVPHADPLPRVRVVPPLLLANDRFVPAVPRVADNLKLVAGSWITQLFDTSTGQPLPNRITRNKGQVQIKSPEPEVVAYLEALEIVRVGEGKQLYYNMALYPTLREAINAVRTGVRPPSYAEGEGRVLVSGGEEDL